MGSVGARWRGMVDSPSLWKSAPALAFAAAAVVGLGLSVVYLFAALSLPWDYGIGREVGIFFGVLSSLCFAFLAFAYADAFLAVLRGKSSVVTWVRITLEMVLSAGLLGIWVGAVISDESGLAWFPLLWFPLLALVNLYIVVLGWMRVSNRLRRDRNGRVAQG